MKKVTIYQGKAKKIYSDPNSEYLIAEYMDQITAGNGEKKDEFIGKGKLNNQISGLLFQLMNEIDIDHHFINQVDENSQHILPLEMIPLEVVVRNIAAGSIVKRLGIPEKTCFVEPLVEFYFKKDELGDPFINDDHVLFLTDLNTEEIIHIKATTLKLNQWLQKVFQACGFDLVDFKVEFGRDSEGKIILGDEISPDTCRLWDQKNEQSYDKDRYRKNDENIVHIYQEVFERLQKLGGK